MRRTSGLVLGTFKQIDGLPEDLSEGTTRFGACRIAVGRPESPSLFAVRCVRLHSVTDRTLRSLKQQLRCLRNYNNEEMQVVVRRWYRIEWLDLCSGGNSDLSQDVESASRSLGLDLRWRIVSRHWEKLRVLRVTVTAHLCF